MLSPHRVEISNRQARRIALAAQGFDLPRPTGRVDSRHIRRLLHRLGALQLDFVNVLVPAHRMILFSRLGPYKLSAFNRLVYQSSEFTEQWAHEAAIVPMDVWPLLNHRRRSHKIWSRRIADFIDTERAYIRQVMRKVKRDGPVTAGDLPPAPELQLQRLPGDWRKSIGRMILEAHFGRGVLAIADRLPNFQRVYDLSERLIPTEHYNKSPGKTAEQRELLLRAAKAHGLGTATDLADYYRLPIKEARALIQELVSEDQLVELQVGGWSDPAYTLPKLSVPGPITTARLLSPFDPLVWFRPRVERLFGFHYRIEIYVPEAKRKWGYYVLPFLLDDQLVARVDLKADRGRCCLRVQAAHIEDRADSTAVVEPLAKELHSLARWLELDEVVVGRRGRLANSLRAAVKHYRAAH